MRSTFSGVFIIWNSSKSPDHLHKSIRMMQTICQKPVSVGISCYAPTVCQPHWDDPSPSVSMKNYTDFCWCVSRINGNRENRSNKHNKSVKFSRLIKGESIRKLSKYDVYPFPNLTRCRVRLPYI